MVMQFSVEKRDGPARIGELVIENKRIITPNILCVNIQRFKAPNFADILMTNDDYKKGKPTLKILGSMFLPSNGKDDGDLQVSNFLVYPKDLPKELHLSAIKLYNKEKINCYIIPGDREIINDALKDNSASFFIVANSFQLFQQPRKFVDFIAELRQKIGYQKMIYLPSVGDPTCFALLAYMGVDFFDSVSAIQAARDNILLFPNGRYNKDELKELPCTCPSCNKFKGKPSDMSFQEILDHNYFTILNEIKQVRNSIARGNLRGLVETRVQTNPALTAMLRNLDMNHYTFLEERTPITSKYLLLATTKESFFRPEIKRFQERVAERYRKPECTKILVLLPCSAKKPYSFSKSHRLYKEKLYNSGNPFVVHEVVVTSPLGVVPRELELLYPASAYDLPVTGIWDEDEKKMIRELLKKYLEINKYDKTISHLPKEIIDFIDDILDRPMITCVDSPTSRDSLDKLSNVLKKNVGSYEKTKPQVRMREDIESFASYQFGRKIAEKLLKNCKIKGRYPYQKIIHNNKQLGMVTKERGLISLTLEGAKRIVDSEVYWVEIYDDFSLKGSVFAPGVKNADSRIRVGDEVVVLKNKKLCAVGVAQMNGDEMKELSHGEAIKIRHRM